MGFENLEILSTKALEARLAKESGVNIPSFSYNALKSLSQQDLPFVLRIPLTDGSKKPKVLWVWQWFKIWELQANEEIETEVRQTAKDIGKYLKALFDKGEISPGAAKYVVQLSKQPVGRPREYNKKTPLEIVGGDVR